MFTRHSLLRETGTSVLPASEIKRLAEEAIAANLNETLTEIEIIRKSPPSDDETPETTFVVFDKFGEDEPNLLYGHTAAGDAMIFMLQDLNSPAIVLIYAPPATTGG